jgi:ATP-binding cassette subfamily B protein
MPTDIPDEYRESVEALLRKEPSHALDDGDAEPEPKGTFSLPAFLRPYRGRLLFALLLVSLSTVVNNLGPLIFARAIDDGIVGRDFSLLFAFAMIYLLTVLLRIGLRYLSTHYLGRLGQDLLYRLRNRVFAHLQRLSYDYHDKARPGHTLTLLTGDINTLSSLLQDGLINFVVQALALFVIGAVLFSMNVPLALILLAAVVPPMMFATLWFRRISKRTFKRARARGADLTSDLRQTLYGMRQIRIFDRAAHSVREHDGAIVRFQKENDGIARLTALYSAITDFIEIAAQCVVIYFGFRFVVSGTLTIGELVAFVLFLKRFFAPLEQLTLLFRDFQSAQAALDRIARFLSVRPTIVDAVDAAPLRVDCGAIRFRGVSLAYDPGVPALDGIDLDVAPGERLSIVGATGSGKSTLIKALSRLLQPDAGRIEIDGQDIAGVTLASLRGAIGVIQQEPVLFHGTLRENLRFAAPDADDSALESACRAARLESLIARLPNGLDSPVYAQGTSLSAGERQLIAIARLLLMNPAIVVMDEATSHLDPGTERLIEDALHAVSHKRTTIVVSHRLDRMSRADRIVVMAAGRIVETGSHAALVAAGGAYAELIRRWNAPGERDPHNHDPHNHDPHNHDPGQHEPGRPSSA